MDTLPFNYITPEVRRLLTFYRIPFPNDRKLSFANSPAKLARAGFMRLENAPNDEVICEICKITYSNWEGESPFAVHIVLSEQCPFLSTPSADDMTQSHPLVMATRRQWFPADDETPHCEMTDMDDSGYASRLDVSEQSPEQSYVSVLSTETKFSFPFQPKAGDVSMLFASRRLKTFRDRNCRLCVKWAEEGFMFRSDTGEVQCVFCAVVFPFDSFNVQQLHAENSVLCPRILMKDVGNVTRAEEERIRLKYLQQQIKAKKSPQSFAVWHPQYEEESHRIGTYENWPHRSCQAEQLYSQPSVMSEVGFFFSGCADRVQCYCCGLGLYQWKQGADPWEQHALRMPTCPLVQSKGLDFIQEAAEAEVLTKVVYPARISFGESFSSSGQVTTLSPGSLTMDMSAVTAALTTSRFPTKDILIGQLRANDVNFTDLCKQRDINHRHSTVIQQKTTELQQSHTVIQHKDQVIQHKDQVIQHKDQVIQQHRQELQQYEEELEFHRQVVRNQGQELQQKEVELERRRRLMAYQEQQITSLQVQMQALLAERRQVGQQAALLQAADNAGTAAENSPVTCDIRCKVCLSAESNTIFQPCHHITCCKPCAEQLVSEVCPVCRAPICDVLPAFIS